MRLIPANDYEGARLYRSPSEIREDITNIAACIERADMRLSLHEILTSLATDSLLEAADSKKCLSIVEESVDRARIAIRRMERMCKALNDLIYELEEAKWARGI